MVPPAVEETTGETVTVDLDAPTAAAPAFRPSELAAAFGVTVLSTSMSSATIFDPEIDADTVGVIVTCVTDPPEAIENTPADNETFATFVVAVGFAVATTVKSPDTRTSEELLRYERVVVVTVFLDNAPPPLAATRPADIEAAAEIAEMLAVSVALIVKLSLTALHRVGFA